MEGVLDQHDLTKNIYNNKIIITGHKDHIKRVYCKLETMLINILW